MSHLLIFLVLYSVIIFLQLSDFRFRNACDLAHIHVVAIVEIATAGIRFYQIKLIAANAAVIRAVFVQVGAQVFCNRAQVDFCILQAGRSTAEQGFAAARPETLEAFRTATGCSTVVAVEEAPDLAGS